MDKINKIRYNGKDYILSADESKPVTELDDLGDGSKDIIFIGVMNETDKDKKITYSYLSGLLEADNINNKVFEPTTLPITVRTKWDYDGVCKAPFIIVPSNHPSLYMLSNGTQAFTGCEDETQEILIDFPNGIKSYKIYRFENWLVWMNSPLTYTF